MSSDIAIQVSDISKCFHLYESPRDRLKQFILPRVRRALGMAPRHYYREFWALRNVSFSVRKGETVGIIGRNGAGKSTLLQILCGTLSPTSGEVGVNGRIAALLELGAGFNHQFSGRENVYMSGGLLGLSRREIDERMDEILAFADIGDFIDQPVRTYSSGMYVRLAFAVSACVDPDVLIVDEALAVGDIAFQYRCYKRLEALRSRGTTILLVTHSTSAVLEYCDRCALIDGGELVRIDDDVLAVVMEYEKRMRGVVESTESAPRHETQEDVSHAALVSRQKSERNVQVGENRFGTARAIIDSVVLKDAESSDGSALTLRAGADCVILFRILSSEVIDNVALGVSISGAQSGDIWGDNNLYANRPLSLNVGENLIEYRFKMPVGTGEYLLHCGLACYRGDAREELDQRRPILKFLVWSPREQVGVAYSPITVQVR